MVLICTCCQWSLGNIGLEVALSFNPDLVNSTSTQVSLTIHLQVSILGSKEGLFRQDSLTRGVWNSFQPLH